MALTTGEIDAAVPVSGKPDRARTNAAMKQLVTDVAAVGSVAAAAGAGVSSLSSSLSPALQQGALVSVGDAPSTVMPDEVVRLSASGCAFPCPGYISRIRCVTGTTVSLTVYDNPAASSGTVLYTGTLSAGQEAVLSAEKVRVINGVRAVFASGSFDFSVGQETA